MGIIDLFGRQLRIDVRSVTKEQYPFALLYFTGSKQFNTTIRLHAKKMGYKLNEYNLGNFKGDIIRTEKDIFKALKIKYLKPEER
jgi:DNA polymerase/3'-5' exonuclease PolX